MNMLIKLDVTMLVLIITLSAMTCGMLVSNQQLTWATFLPYYIAHSRCTHIFAGTRNFMKFWVVQKNIPSMMPSFCSWTDLTPIDKWILTLCSSWNLKILHILSILLSKFSNRKCIFTLQTKSWMKKVTEIFPEKYRINDTFTVNWVNRKLQISINRLFIIMQVFLKMIFCEYVCQIIIIYL